MNRKRNVVRLLTVDAKSVDSGSDRQGGGGEGDDVSLMSQSQKLISHLPAANTLIRKRQSSTASPIQLTTRTGEDEDNSTIASYAPSYLSTDSSTTVSKYSTEKYFGSYAKNSLNDRYKWLCRVNNDLLHSPTTEDTLLKTTPTVFGTPLEQINDFPFAVRRPDIEDDQDELEEDEEEGEGDEEDELLRQEQQIPTDDSVISGGSLTRPRPSSHHRLSSSSHSLGQRPSYSSSPPPLSLTHIRSSPRSASISASLSQSPSHSHSHRPFSSSSSSSSLNGPPTSPRSKYLVGCLRESLNPRASLILRKHVNQELNLQHLGMGDKMGLVFASSLSELPHVSSLNLCDNNLTDKSLSEIIQTICRMSHLTALNLSINKIDSQSCKALAEYLLQPFCGLRSLNLHKADIDDFECHMFVAALDRNTVRAPLLSSLSPISHSYPFRSLPPCHHF
jgi:hypothetical protein